MNRDQIAAVCAGVAIISGAMWAGRRAGEREVEEQTRNTDYAVFEIENDAWLEERRRDIVNCHAREGVPVFTLGMRMFCVSESAIIGDVMPKRVAPETPRMSP